MPAQSEVTSFRVLPRSSAFFRVLLRSSAAKKRHTHDSCSVCSVCSVVSDGFRLKTPLLNKCMRDLPGLKPRLRFLDRGATNARAKRGRVIPRSSAAKTRTHPRFLFRVFRGESWFRVENRVIEQVCAQLARAKAQATVFGPCKSGSRRSASFRVLPRPKTARPTIPFPCVPCVAW